MKTHLADTCRRLAQTKQRQREILEYLDAPAVGEDWSGYADALRTVTGSVKLRTLSGEGRIAWEDGAAGADGAAEKLSAAVISGKVEQQRYKGYNRMELMGNCYSDTVQVTYDAESGIFTLNGTRRSPGNILLSRGGRICWGEGSTFYLVREKLGGSVTLDDFGAGRFLLWAVFAVDHSVYTTRNREHLQNTENAKIYTATDSQSYRIEESPAGSGYQILLQVMGCSEENPVVFTDYRVRLMLVDQADGVPAEYEPFTGGEPIPSPAQPMPITVSEATAVESSGGGIAVAPRLCAVPETEFCDTWDTQSGRGVRRCAEILSYAGEEITTPYISSTGELSEGAHVIWGIPDTPFETPPQILTQTAGAGSVQQIGGSVEDCPLRITYRRQERLEERKTVLPAAEGLEILPEEGFDAMVEVCLTGDVNFKPWNIRSGVEIWGKRGSAAAAEEVSP